MVSSFPPPSMTNGPSTKIVSARDLIALRSDPARKKRTRDEGRGEVVDLFLDYHSVGHEPATVQVRHMQSYNSAKGMDIKDLVDIVILRYDH